MLHLFALFPGTKVTKVIKTEISQHIIMITYHFSFGLCGIVVSPLHPASKPSVANLPSHDLPPSALSLTLPFQYQRCLTPASGAHCSGHHGG